MKNIKLLLSIFLVGLVGLVGGANAEFTPESIGTTLTLPRDYPDHWMLVHDVSFFHMLEGEILVIDPLAENLQDQFKGMFTASFTATFKASADRGEFYVAESFFSRGGRGGERTDVVTIWDAQTLTVKEEIQIPPKRISGMPKTLMSGFIEGEKFLGIYNFTPAQSVSIVNLKTREFVGEIPTPGCGFLLPNGQRSFSSICANGTLRTSALNDDGTLSRTVKTSVVFDPDKDPIFESPGLAGHTAYFTTFQGRVLPIDTSGDELQVGKAWWLTDSTERNWQPSGMMPITVDSAGTGYLLMNPQGGEGTHKDGGTEVWVYDLEMAKRTGRIKLNTRGISLGTTGTGNMRLLIVTNAEMGLDVYRIPGGDFVQTLSTGAQTPFMVYEVN